MKIIDCPLDYGFDLQLYGAVPGNLSPESPLIDFKILDARLDLISGFDGT